MTSLLNTEQKGAGAEGKNVVISFLGTVSNRAVTVIVVMECYRHFSRMPTNLL
jgi:hypothetical protein